jgi:hypothetical protein
VPCSGAWAGREVYGRAPLRRRRYCRDWMLATADVGDTPYAGKVHIRK